MENTDKQSVHIALTREDYIPFLRYVSRSIRNTRIYTVVVYIVGIILLTQGMEIVEQHKLLPEALIKSEYGFFAVWLAVAMVFIFVGSKWLRVVMKREYINDNQNFLRARQLSIDDSGIYETTDVSKYFIQWQGIDKIEKTPQFLLAYIDKLQAFCIPLRSFATPQLADQFHENMLAYWHKANGRVSR